MAIRYEGDGFDVLDSYLDVKDDEEMNKWSNEEIAFKADSEGLAYMITSYLSADSIEDEELKILWKQADEVLSKIEKILEPYLP